MRIKNWGKFQHYKDRRPQWIKLHRDILEQRDISVLSDCSFRFLIGLWILAADDKTLQGELPCIDDISFRLRMKKSKVVEELQNVSFFLEQDDSTLLADSYQDSSPRALPREEKRREDIYRASSDDSFSIENLFLELWDLYIPGHKKGKARVNFNAKREIFDLGKDHFMRCIERYKKHADNIEWYTPQHGSTFFNGGYKDYTDEAYEETKTRIEVSNDKTLEQELRRIGG